MTAHRKAIAVLAISFALLGTAASLACAEVTERGDLFVSFSGGILPGALPRNTLAPIAVHIVGAIRTPSGASPPAVRQITVALNRAGHLDTRGLALCPASRISSTTTSAALAACRGALIGTGSYAAQSAFPEQKAFPSRGRIFAFNSTSHGHRTVLAHVYGTDPAPITRLFTFRIHRVRGTYGTVLTGTLPASLNHYGYLKRISLSLHRTFTYRGRPRSYLSAACGAPRGFPGAVFPFARASMTFVGGQVLSATLTRTCEVSQ